jgi:adenylate cyclase
MLIDPDNINMRYNFACVLAGYGGDKDEALHLLDGALAFSGLTQLKIAETDPDLDPLRDDPRFQKILKDAKRRLGIKDEPAPQAAGPQITSATS